MKVIFDKNCMLLLLLKENERIDFSMPDFEKKQKQHITILTYSHGKKIKAGFKDQEREIQQIRELVDSTDWNFSFKEEVLHLKRKYDNSEVRESYIQMVDIPSLDDFFTKFNVMTGLNLTPPPVHITIATKGGYDGIGISSKEDLEKYKI